MIMKSMYKNEMIFHAKMMFVKARIQFRHAMECLLYEKMTHDVRKKNNYLVFVGLLYDRIDWTAWMPNIGHSFSLLMRWAYNLGTLK